MIVELVQVVEHSNLATGVIQFNGRPSVDRNLGPQFLGPVDPPAAIEPPTIIEAVVVELSVKAFPKQFRLNVSQFPFRPLRIHP